MDENRRIVKIKIKKDGIFIAWQEKNSDRAGEWDDYTLRCCDQARKEFYDFMELMNEHVRSICELPDGDEKRIKATGISYSYDEAQTYGVVFTAQRELYDTPSPLNLNTPFKYGEAPDGALEEICLDNKCIFELSKLSEECFKYINGDRNEANLFDNTEKAETIEDKPPETEKAEQMATQVG